MIKQIFIMIIIGVTSFCVLSCSRTSSNMPVSPFDMSDSQFQNDSNIPAPNNDDVPHNRVLWGIWDVAPSSDRQGAAPNPAREQGLRISPSRELAYHYNVTSWIQAPTIVLRSYNQQTNIASIDFTIANPFAISGYDVRLIVYTDALGHKLTNADDWTALHDLPGGLPINPFKAYTKSEPYRKFAGQSQYTENCKIYLPGGNWHFTIAVDASYPSNCEEPYELTNFTQGIILDQLGSSTECEVTAHSWSNDVNSVKLYCPQITGTTLVSFSPIDSEKWGYTLTNNTGAASGNYFGYLIATTSKSGSLALYDEVTIKITPLNSGWARTWGGVGDDGCHDVAVDADGNVYSTGGFMSSVDFDPTPEGEDIRTSNGLEDIFLVKYDKYGNYQWAKTIGGGLADLGYAVDIDSSGNILVAGVFSSTVDFGTDEIPDIKTSRGGTDCFLTKYNSSGNYLWTKAWGGGGIDSPRRIHIGKNGDIGITGYFEGTADFNPDPTQTDNHTANGIYDVFLLKLNSDGIYQWAKTWGGNDSYGDWGSGVALDSIGNVYCSGSFSATCDFDPGPGTDIHARVGNSWWDAFLSSFDSNGNFRWAHTWGSTYQDESHECAVDEYDDVYVVGNFYYTVDFNPDPLETEERTAAWHSDVFVSKFAPDGDFKWVLTWGGTQYDYGRILAFDRNGHFWVGGETMGYNIDYDPGDGVDIKNGGAFTSNFDINGQYNWVRTWKGDDMALVCMDVASDSKAILGGWYDNGSYFDFDPSENTWYSQNYVSGFDCFIIKLLSNGYWE